MLNSFYLVFTVLIIYSQQVSILMKQHIAPKMCIGRAKKEDVSERQEIMNVKLRKGRKIKQKKKKRRGIGKK